MMISAHQYVGEDSLEWDEFVERSCNGTIFHLRRFLNYHSSDKFVDRSIVFRNGSNVIAVLPAVEIGDDNGSTLVSHPGASYGGIVFETHPSYERVLMLLEMIDSYCISHGLSSIRMRFAPKIFCSRIIEQMDFALLRYGYSRAVEELTTYYVLDDFDHASSFEEFVCVLPKKPRSDIRKAMRSGLVGRFGASKAELKEFYELLLDSLNRRHAVRPTHTLDEMEYLFANLPARLRLLGVYDDGRMLGGLIIFEIVNGKWHIFYSCQAEKSGLPVTSFAVATLLWHAKQENIQILNYGISTVNRGSEVNLGLLRFKEQFGGVGCIRTTWERQLEAVL